MDQQSKKTGVLLINVGTPDAPEKAAVRRYLAEFLTDKRVVSLPTFFRYLLVYGLILPFRTKKSTEAYKEVWDKSKGSPLLYLSESFADKLRQHLGSRYEVALGMRYGNPSITSALDTLMANNIDELIIAPLYPQYASATNSSALEKVFDYFKKQQIIPKLRTLDAFYHESAFIQNKANLIKPYLSQKWDAFLFSYHGLPFDQIKKAEKKPDTNCFKDLPCPAINHVNQNCYRAQCYQTTTLLAKTLSLEPESYMVSFQSRVGMNRWIGPDTETAMKILMGKGRKNLLVACPSFVTDCLETLEEIKLRAQEMWHDLGGESLTLVPCLNDSPDWVAGFAELITQQKRS